MVENVDSKTRTLKELIPLMISYIELFEISGLCGVVDRLTSMGKINAEEAGILYDFVHTAKSKWYQPRYYCINGVNERKFCAYYWTPGKKKPRLKWLRNQLDKL